MTDREHALTHECPYCGRCLFLPCVTPNGIHPTRRDADTSPFQVVGAAVYDGNSDTLEINQ